MFELWFSQDLCPVVRFLGHMVALFLDFFITELHIIVSSFKLPEHLTAQNKYMNGNIFTYYNVIHKKMLYYNFLYQYG